jgi:hypothetical protein
MSLGVQLTSSCASLQCTYHCAAANSQHTDQAQEASHTDAMSAEAEIILSTRTATRDF